MADQHIKRAILEDGFASIARRPRTLALLACGLLLLVVGGYARLHASPHPNAKLPSLSVDNIIPANGSISDVVYHSAGAGVVDGSLIAIGQGEDGQSVYVGRSAMTSTDQTPGFSHDVVRLAGVRLHPDSAGRMKEIRGNPSISWREVYCRPVSEGQFQCTALDRDPIAGDQAKGGFHYFDLAEALVSAGLADATASLPVIPIEHFIQRPAKAGDAVTARSMVARPWLETYQLYVLAFIAVVFAASIATAKWAPRVAAEEYRRAFTYLVVLIVVPAGFLGWSLPNQLAGGRQDLLVHLAQIVGVLGFIFIAVRGIKLALMLMALGFAGALATWLATGHWLAF